MKIISWYYTIVKWLKMLICDYLTSIASWIRLGAQEETKQIKQIFIRKVFVLFWKVTFYRYKP